MSSRTRARGLRAATAVLAAAVLLAGCTGLPFLGGGGTKDDGRPGPTGEDVPAELEQYYTQTPSWSGCGASGIDCTEVTVPLDWDDPTGDTIQIAIARHKASGTPIGSLLINPGGPGGSGYDFVHDSVDYIVTSDVLDDYDVIGFDPRGVNHSTPVECYTDSADQDEWLYGTYSSAYGTQGWLDELTERAADWTAACDANTGALMGHLDAASVARDMDVIRAVLGDTELHYLGYSYGTYLGTMYAELFPEKVGRMVLDGAVDPSVGDLDALATQMAGFDSGLRAYMTWCISSGGDCPFSGDVDAAMKSVRQMLDTVDARHFVASDGRELDSATVATGIILTLYSESYWPELSNLFTSLRKGDADTVFVYADAYNGRDAGGGYSDNSMEIYTAVTCNEGDLATDGVSTLDGLAKIDAAAPILGRYAAYDDYAMLDVVCSNWPYPVAELPTTFDAQGAPPIMVIGTTNDPATPYANAVSLSKQLSSGFLVSYEGEGHTIYAQGVACVDDTVDAYLLKGTVPASDPMC
ncbi:alpha/beta hydrolase [Protaetiibacter intestinalis]|uniref:Alpha/beta hydrolase n=1 Tax=Protaetiibacter intestinalis TaxID=2419774 RepID=A0A387B5A2_9MICO|nr:alpha/beta hydrolase [Protaetiibacter intestinalis]AYF97487.1 alpha/beta hydrolase [Protaetiibacter intestinalis]